MVAFLIALLPPLGAALIFWIGIRAIVQADRRERAAQARFEAQRRPDNRDVSQSLPLSPEEGAVGGREEGSSGALPSS